MTTNPAYRWRWWLAALLLVCSILNYVDRVAIGIVAADIKQEFQLSDTDYALIPAAFLLSYAVFYTVGGRFMDLIGPWIGVPLSLAWWSVANILHALSQSVGHLCVFRALLAVGEASYFTAAVKAVQRTFPPADQSKGVAIMFMGITIGMLFAAPCVGLLAHHYGWRMAFVVTGAMGFVVLPFWWLLSHKIKADLGGGTEPEQMAQPPAESDQVNSSTAIDSPWSILRLRPTWVLFVTRMCTDAAWYFYVFWLPLYFVQERGFDKLMIAKYLWIPFLMADIGYIAGGWIPSRLIHRGWSLNAARKVVMAVSALTVPVGILAVLADTTQVALAWIGLSCIGITAWGTNLTALHSDMYPENRVGTAFGLTGTAGALGGAILLFAVGPILDRTGSYYLAFLLMGSLHPIGICLIVFALGRIRRL